MREPCCCPQDNALTTCEDVDAAIAHLQRRIRSLIGRRNTLAPINSRLPKEVLCEIFLQLASECFHRRHERPRETFGTRSSVGGNNRPSNEPSLIREGYTAPRTRYAEAYAWLVVIHVCRYWRDTAYAFPNLWSIISIRHNSRGCVEQLLKRSKQAPLTIEHDYSIATDRGMPPAILGEIHRIRSLRTQDGNAWSKLEKSLSDASVLEILDITVAGDIVREHPTEHTDRAPMAPKLRELSLRRASPAILHALSCSTLVKLRVAFLQPLYVSLTDLLRRLPLLEELHLDDVLAYTPDLGTSGGPLSLPRLRSLYLNQSQREHWKAPASLLACLVVPSTVRLNFRGHTPDEYVSDYESLYRSIASIVSNRSFAPPQHPIACHIQSDVIYSLELNMWSQDIPMHELDITDLEYTSAKAKSSITIVWRGHYTGAAFHALLCYFPLTKLRTLHLENVSIYGDTWWTLAQAQNLREIKVEPHALAIELIAALQSPPPPLDELPKGHPPFSDRLFPKLETLTLRSVKWNTHTHTHNAEQARPVVADVEAMLESRRSHGVPLKRLFLEDGINTHTDEMDRLRDSGELEAFSWDSDGGRHYRTSCDDCNANKDGSTILGS